MLLFKQQVASISGISLLICNNVQITTVIKFLCLYVFLTCTYNVTVLKASGQHWFQNFPCKGSIVMASNRLYLVTDDIYLVAHYKL